MRFSSEGRPESSVTQHVTSSKPVKRNRIERLRKSASPALRALVQRIHGQPAQKLRIEISRFLRQNLAGKCNVTHLTHAHRVHEKSGISTSATHALDGL